MSLKISTIIAVKVILNVALNMHAYSCDSPWKEVLKLHAYSSDNPRKGV